MRVHWANIIGFFPSVLVALLLGPVPAQAQTADFSDVRDYIDESIKTMKEDLKNLPATTDVSLLGVDQAVPAMIGNLEFARAALTSGNIDASMDVLGVNIGIAAAVLGNLPTKKTLAVRTPVTDAASINTEEVNALTPQDVDNVKSVVTRMAKAEIIEIENVEAVFERLEVNGLDVGELTGILSAVDLSQLDVISAINQSSDRLGRMDDLVGKLSSIIGSSGLATNIANRLQSAGVNLNDLQVAAEVIASAISHGIDVDLEAAAQGLGYNSFAAAVDAYNAAHGTNYSVQGAKDALGQ